MTETLSDRRIVVGVDGSAPSLRALRWAATEAVRRGAGLDVVHAWMTPCPLSAPEVFVDPAPFEAQGRAVLERSVTSLTSSDRVPRDLRPVLVEERATKALLQASDGAQLLVVASRGRGGSSGLVLGSVSRHCTHHASCPVAVIPPAWTGEEHGRIVVGVDGSEPSYRALRWAIADASLRNARLDVVNAYNDAQVVMPSAERRGAVREYLETASRTMLQQMVDSALGAAEHRPKAVETISVEDSAARALLDCAQKADLLVVGSRGRGAVRGMLLGSVSQQSVLHASCPAVVVRDSSDTSQTPR